MPGSTTSVFGEPDDFRAALRKHGNVNFYLTGHGRLLARLTKLKMYRLCTAAVVENLPQIGFWAVPPDAVMVVFPIGDRPPPIWGGNRPTNSDLITFGPDHRVHVRTHGPCRWGAIWLSAQVLAGYFHELTNGTLTLAPVAQLWRPPRRLLQLHAAAIRAVEVRPETIVDPEAAHGMEQQLVEALVKCLSGKPLPEQPKPKHWYQGLAVRFEELLQNRRDRAFREDALGAELGVSAHSLRACCMQELGMSPMSYIRLRALHRVHDILQGGTVDVESVSQVARDHGFRDLGRFAESYRTLFGQLPSTTSRRLHRRASIVP
jgi:AraC-like DNA-binding protein